MSARCYRRDAGKTTAAKEYAHIATKLQGVGVPLGEQHALFWRPTTGSRLNRAALVAIWRKDDTNPALFGHRPLRHSEG